MRLTRFGFGWVLLILVATSSSEVMAYIGPGIGAGLIATVLGVLAAIVLAVFGVVYYPLKRFFRNRKHRRVRTDDGNGFDR
jgi:biopolymer transport protein ExbB/TolQ